MEFLAPYLQLEHHLLLQRNIPSKNNQKLCHFAKYWMECPFGALDQGKEVMQVMYRIPQHVSHHFD